MTEPNYFQGVKQQADFSRHDLLLSFRSGGFGLSEASFYKKFAEIVKEGEIIRVGRDRYCFSNGDKNRYEHEYSALANGVANLIKEQYPRLRFSVLELIQLNNFVNHQIVHNVVFLFAEEDIMEFVFDTLKEQYPGKVLLRPTPEIYHRYWSDDMIIIGKLTTEAPKGQAERWHTRIEKLLVDIVAESLLLESISESDYPHIYEDAFLRYVVDESCLFRYAKRRKVDKKIKVLIKAKTNITLHIERCFDPLYSRNNETN